MGGGQVTVCRVNPIQQLCAWFQGQGSAVHSQSCVNPTLTDGLDILGQLQFFCVRGSDFLGGQAWVCAVLAHFVACDIKNSLPQRQ